MTFDLSKLPKDLQPVIQSAIEERNDVIAQSMTETRKLIKSYLEEIADALGTGKFEETEELLILMDSVKNKIATGLDDIIKAGTLRTSIAAVGVGAASLENFLDEQGKPSSYVRPLFLDRATKFASRFAEETVRQYAPGTKWKLSDRIWDISGNNIEDIQRILQAGEGTDAVKLSKSLRKYIREGRESFADAYPNMMDRMEGRLAKTTSYEALRVCRTELSDAYWAGAIEGYKDNDAIVGVKVILSNNRGMQEEDICDVHVRENLFGLGPGVYPVDQAPPGVFHPNCLCTIIPVLRKHIEGEMYGCKSANHFRDCAGHRG